MPEIVWETPVCPDHKGRGKVGYEWFRNALRERPGEWARYPGTPRTGQSAGATAGAIKSGKSRQWGPAGTFEAVYRTIDGQPIVFVRYVGDRDDQ